MNCVIFKPSYEIIYKILNHLVKEGWIKKVDGLHDEVGALMKFMDEEFELQEEIFKDYLTYADEIKKAKKNPHLLS